MNILEKFKASPVIPVLTLENKEEALFVADALVSSGLTNLEITLRTQNALECIEVIAKEFPQAQVGAGTIVLKEQFLDVKNAGGIFAVSPGHTKELVEEARSIGIDYLPGSSTPSEIISLLQLGVTFQKFFHAGNSGGYKMLQAYANIFSQVQFCPTGGISEKDFKEYLNLNNVLCLGGSWMVSSNDIKNKNYTNIKKAASSIIESLKA